MRSRLLLFESKPCLPLFCATFLIDKRGRIAAKYVGVVDKADVEANLKVLLAER